MVLTIYILAFRDIIGTAFVLLSLETRDVAARVSGGKLVQSAELDIVGHCAIYLGQHLCWLRLDLRVTPCWWVPIRTKQLSTVTAFLYRFLSCWCLARLTFPRSISFAVMFVCWFIFWLIRSFQILRNLAALSLAALCRFKFLYGSSKTWINISIWAKPLCDLCKIH